MPIGIIVIVVGGLSILMNACGMLSAAVMPAMFSKMPAANMPPNFPAELMQFTPAVLVVTGFRVVLGVVLLAIGIGLVQRRAWSVRAVRPWAIVAIAICVIGAVAEYQLQQRNLAIIENNPGMQMPFSQGMFAGFALVSTFFYLALRLALPVFLLIWFGRRAIKDEVAGWRDAEVSTQQDAGRG